MTTAAATRKPRTTPIGTGALHQALETSRDIARLHDFCSAHACTPSEVSSDGLRLDPLKVFALMRQRGYLVSDPHRPQQQLNRSGTTWLVDVTLPSGAAVQLAFVTPNTS